MTDTILRAIVFVFVAAFLGILIWHVPRVDLIVLVAFTLTLVGRDLLWPQRKG